MKIPYRLEQALTRLYEAFHNDNLYPECCKQCAVGNILDKSDSWKHLSDDHGSLRLNYVGLVNEKVGKRFNGYTPMELLRIEFVFLKACGYTLPLKNGRSRPAAPISKDTLFVGLEATVAYLCDIDGISDIMDCSALFNYKPNYTKEISV